VRARALIFALAGCGRLGFDAPATSDAASRICDGFTPIIDLPGTYQVTGPESWANNRFACFDLGADLAFPTTATEALDLANFANNAGFTVTWLGIHDLETEGTFETVDGKAAPFQNWAASEPDGGTVANCVRMDDSGRMFDDDCRDAFVAICACK